MLSAASVFQHGMLLQRSIPVAIWGQADPNTIVMASIQKRTASTSVGKDGYWQLELPPRQASENETLLLTSGDEQLVFTDVAVGEVWLAGGQSNMEFHMRYEKHLQQELPSCENNRLRFYDVPKVSFEGQMAAFDYSQVGKWRKASSIDLEWFSAVGYYFQKELAQVLDVPVGIVGCNWGGENWRAMDGRFPEADRRLGTGEVL